MTEQAEEWGPWIEHDGNGCPCVGRYVQLIDVTKSGVEGVAEGIAGRGGGYSWDWRYSETPVPGTGGKFATKIVRYRIRRPRALRDLIALARDARSPADLHREVCEEWEAAEGGRTR